MPLNGSGDSFPWLVQLQKTWTDTFYPLKTGPDTIACATQAALELPAAKLVGKG